MERKGIDVSSHQSNINWEKVKADGIEFAMIRITYGKKKVDTKAIKNIEGCIAAGIPFGVYVYSYALNTEDAKAEADLLLKTLAPYKANVAYPVVIDMEDADSYKKKNGFPSDDTLVSICDIECQAFENAGYYASIYASKSWFDTHLKSNRLDRYDKWLAWWNEDAKFDTAKNGLWQYTSDGKVAGISGRVDMNKAFKDYPTIIKNMNKQPAPAPAPAPAPKVEAKPAPVATPTFKVGDKVKLKTAVTYTGGKLAIWTLAKVYSVIEVRGDRIVIGQGKAVTAAVKSSNLRKV